MKNLTSKSKTLLLFLALSAPLSAAWAVDIKVAVKGEQLAFEPAKFSVKAGETVNITFTNASKAMEHNFVVGKPGTADKIMQDSLASGAPSWTSTGAEVVAKTPMTKPTATEKLTFTAPKEKGDYPFLCTFPGHGSVMRGTMTIK